MSYIDYNEEFRAIERLLERIANHDEINGWPREDTVKALARFHNAGFSIVSLHTGRTFPTRDQETSP